MMGVGFSGFVKFLGPHRQDRTIEGVGSNVLEGRKIDLQVRPAIDQKN